MLLGRACRVDVVERRGRLGGHLLQLGQLAYGLTNFAREAGSHMLGGGAPVATIDRTSGVGGRKMGGGVGERARAEERACGMDVAPVDC